MTLPATELFHAVCESCVATDRTTRGGCYQIGTSTRLVFSSVGLKSNPIPPTVPPTGNTPRNGPEKELGLPVVVWDGKRWPALSPSRKLCGLIPGTLEGRGESLGLCSDHHHAQRD